MLGPLERRVGMIGADDLSRIWAGPRALLTGSDPYDPSSWYATAVALGTQPPDTAVYIYPPWVTLVLLPLAALPLAAASAVWLAAGLAASILMLRRALRVLLPDRAVEHALGPLVIMLSWSAVVNLVIGQWGHLLVAALFATALALRDGRVVSAGLTAVAMIIKPQLFLLTAPALAVRALWPAAGRRPQPGGIRFIVVALALTAALIAVAWIVLPQWWPSWLEGVAGRQIQATRNTVSGFLGTVAGSFAASLAPLVILALAAVALRFHPRSPGWLPVWLSLSLVAVPYASSYDHVLLIVPIVLAAGALLTVSPGASRSAMVACAAVMLVGTPIMYGIAVLRHSESLSVVVPLAVFAIVTRALWPLASALPATHSGRDVKLSVVIPVYNEAMTVGEVIDRVADVPVDKEIIVVDDGSTDRSLEAVRARGAKVRFVHEGRVNQGKGTAVRIGLTYATGEVTIVQDADLELDPAEYELLLGPIERGETDVVFGSRFLRRTPGIRLKTRIQNRAIVLLTNFLYGARLTDVTTAYRLFRTEVIHGVRLESARFEIESEITAKLLRLGIKIVEVPVSYRPRTSAEGKKIRWTDGISAALALLRWRLAPVSSFAAPEPGDPGERRSVS